MNYLIIFTEISFSPETSNYAIICSRQVESPPTGFLAQLYKLSNSEKINKNSVRS